MTTKMQKYLRCSLDSIFSRISPRRGLRAHGVAHNRQATASLGAVNRGQTRRMWRVYTVGFYPTPEKNETWLAGDGRSWGIATLAEMMSRKMSMTCSLMRELKSG